MGKLTISMAMFNSYVSLPEGTLIKLYCTSIKLPSSTVLYQTFPVANCDLCQGSPYQFSVYQSHFSSI